ncbi:MAG TPA: ABC transporter ATP-binding protein [Hyphomonadaceae bacterium]|jgi:glycerol transport system ATP-binding protein|nr:ABC transporter ATP-binding protein [Hyphomonadaceae bacterium]HPI48244.1 ABC transporter ATP-binding protein [Hyphomonadaceae bacterium]HPN07601.1 ABC transporter ATP-binding protein [Hyphomonadaceae bacterium]
MLELRGVSRLVGGVSHLSDVSLRLERGTLNVLLGPTLSGKTSLMRVMAGLDRPSRGEVWFDGQDVTGRPVAKRNVAMVYQQFINYPGWTVRENIASPLKVRKLPKAEIEREVARAVELLRLGPYLDRKPLELSGGQQQRVALARAIVKKAGLVLLDEPLANLDYKLREELRAELPKLFADSAAVVVYATTEPTEAILLGGATATLSEGRITQFGPTIDVYRRPNSLLTARTFSDPPLNVMPIELAPQPDRYPGAHTLAFRAHHLRLQRKTPQAHAFTLDVKSTEITGSETYVHLNYNGQQWVMLAHGVHAFAPGSQLTVYLEPDDVLRFRADGSAMTLAAEAA